MSSCAPAQRGRQPRARYETKREKDKKAMYPVINAIWYFAIP
jgi:hypothetical protein